MDDLTNKILDAFNLLDPTRDEDWTGAGLPAMRRMKEIVPGVTSEQVAAAFPGFCRDSRGAWADPRTFAVNEITADEVVDAVQSTLGDLEVIGEAREVAAEAFRASLDALRAEHAAAMREVEAAKARADEIDASIAKATEELARVSPTAAEEIKERLKASQAVRRARAAQSAKSQTFARMSPLDRAMASRSGHGARRPNYPVIQIPKAGA
jgi:uncharacterized protein with HEPN domain